MTEVFSNHIGGSSELLVIADIKPGFVPIRTPMSYAARLRRHLGLIDALRRGGLETDKAGSYVGPIDSLRTLQFIQWTLIDNDTRMLLTVSFDRSFEAYMRRIVDVSGPLLDSIFCHCVGFEGLSSDNGFHKFMEFIEANQAPVEVFAAAAPDVSVDDADYFIEADEVLRNERPDDPYMYLATHRMTRPEEKLMQAVMQKPDELLDQSFGILRAMSLLAPLFPPQMEGAATTGDNEIYANLVKTLMPKFWPFLIRRAPGLTAEDKQAQMVELARNGAANVLPALLQASDPGKDALLDRLMKTHIEALGWYSRAPVSRPTSPLPTEPGQIQAGLLEKPPEVSHACLLMLRVDNAAAGRAFLSQMDGLLFPETAGDVRYNMSITHAGLKSIGMHSDRLHEFPRSFREGMSARAGLLGDTDVNHPTNWSWPKSNWPLDAKPREIAPFTIDIIVQLATKAENCKAPGHVMTPQHPLHDEIVALDASLPDGVTLVALEPMERRFSQTEPRRVIGHLGFADGISQPRFGKGADYTAPPAGHGEPPRPEQARTGDLLVGHQSKLDGGGPFARPGPPLLDGTFQVIRKTQVNADEFHQSAAMTPQPAGSSIRNWPKHVAEKMIGRKMDGGLLFDGPADEQDFNFTEDPAGHSTPMQSHIRRANPREWDSPRILRRGFSYGPFDEGDADRGMIFIAYNASLAEQFEVLQRWMSGGNSTGIGSGHGDPLLAPVRPGASRTFRFTEAVGDHREVVHVDLPDKPAATLQWGLYAFTPSRAGMRALASDDITTPTEPEGRGQPDMPDSQEKWAWLLEDADESRRQERARVWAKIRADGGARRTEYGVLVGSAEGVRTLLVNKDNCFSTGPYLGPMQDSIGSQYLGYDRTNEHASKGMDHEKESALVHEYLSGTVGDYAAYERAFDLTTAALTAVPEEFKPGADGASLGRFVLLPRLISDVVAAVCRDQFGLGLAEGMQFGGSEFADPTKPHMPGDFLSAAAYIFGAHPTKTVTHLGQVGGKRAFEVFRALVTKGDPAPRGTLLAHLQQAASDDSYWSDQKIAEVLGTVCSGLIAPVTTSFLSVMYDWITDETLWRYQQLLQEADPCDPVARHQFAQSEILSRVIASMAKRAAPDLIQRGAKCDMTIAGCNIKAGDLMIGSLGSAVADAPDQKRFFLFGGDYASMKGNGAASHHACPGRAMGSQTLLGVVMAIMSFGKIDPSGPLTLYLKS